MNSESGTWGRHALPLVLLFLFWWRFAGSLFVGPGHLYLIDTALLDVPFRVHAAQIIRAGHFPFWTSTLGCGFAQHADGQTGILYPLFGIYLLWPSAMGNDIFMAVHCLIAGLLMYVYLVAQRFHPLAAMLAAVAYFGGPTMLAAHVIPGFIATFCWLPLALLCIDLGMRGHPRALWGCAIVNAVIHLAGIPNSALICFLIEFAYLIRLGWRSGPRMLGTSMLIVFLLPLLLAAPQLLPTYHYFRQSHRGSGTPWEAVVYNCVYTVRDAFTIGVSRAVAIPCAWYGYAAVAAVSMFALALNRHRRGACFWLFLAAGGLMAATGTPLLWLLYRLPVINWFRWPMFYVLITFVAVTVLMAMGASAIITSIEARLGRGSKAAIAVPALLVSFGAWCATYDTLAGCKSRGDFYALASPSILAAARQPGHFRLLPLLHGEIEGGEPETPQQFWTERRMRQSALTLAPNYSLIHRVSVAILKNQIDAVTPRELTELAFSAVPPSLNILRCMAVTHLSEIGPLPSQLSAACDLVAQEPVYLYRLKSPPPRAWMVYRVIEIRDSAERLRTLAADDFDPSTTAIVERDINLAGSTSQGAPPDVTLHEPAPGTLRIHATSARPGLLVVADRYAPEIAVTVDGKSAELLRTNHAFRGVHLSSGRHTVEMRYVPTAFHQGLFASAFGIAVLAAGLALHRPS